VSTPERQFTHTVATRVVLLVLGGITSVVIARSLQPEGRGTYYVIVTVAATALSLGHLSVEQSQVWLWTGPDNRHAVAANSVVLGLSVGAASALAAAVVLLAIGPGRLPAAGHPLLAIALAAIPFSMVVLYLNSVQMLRARLDVVNRGLLLAATVQCGLLLSVGAAGRLSVAWVVGIWALSAGLPLLVLMPGSGVRIANRDWSLARLALGRGLRYHVGSASLFLLFRVDVFILNGLASAAAVGIYSLAVAVAELTRLVTDSIAQVVLPQQAESVRDRAVAITIRATRVTTLVALGLVGLMSSTAPLLVPAVYGSAFSASVSPLLGLAPGLFALGATRAIGAYLLRLDRPLLGSAIVVASLLLNVVLNLVLIPSYGVTGAAVASSVAYCMLALAQVVWFLRATATPPGELLPTREEARRLWTVLRRTPAAVGSGKRSVPS
jgi:O-antigen/teichoic acid export membrane protein